MSNSQGGNMLEQFGDFPSDLQNHIFNYQSTLEDAVRLYPIDMILNHPLFGVRDAMILSAKHARMDVLDFLVRRGVDQRSINMGLLYATMGGRLDVMQYLIEIAGANVDTGSEGVVGEIFVDAKDEEDDGSGAWPKDGPENIECEFNAPLCFAINIESFEILKYLISKGVDINSGDGSALYMACHQRNEELVRFLIENGADPTCDDSCVLPIAIEKEMVDTCFLLVENGANPRKALEEISMSPHVDLVRFLVQSANISVQQTDEMIEAAVCRGNEHVVKYLVERAPMNSGRRKKIRNVISRVSRRPSGSKVLLPYLKSL